MDFLAPATVNIGDICEETIDKLTIDDVPPMLDTTTPSSSHTTTVLDSFTGIRYEIPFTKNIQYQYRSSKTTPEDDLEEIKHQRQLYVRKNLNSDQAAVFDCVKENPNKIIVVQGDPGTGKTFTMLTLANHMFDTSIPPNVVIYKRDLVHMYRFSANGYTVAQFIMRVFRLSMVEYERLEQELSMPMSVEHFLNAIVNLIRCLIVDPGEDDFRHPLLILDEYTVISKPFLLIIMITLYRYRIGAVICGNKNQIENIHNSTHAGQCSAYDIVSAFSTITFNLSRNERCSDTSYNEKVNFIGTLSNDNVLDAWGYALVSAMFYQNIIKSLELSDTIIAKYPSDLTEQLNLLVTEKSVPTSYWYIIKNSVNKLHMRNSEYCLPYPTVQYYKALTAIANGNTGVSEEYKKWYPGKYLTFLPLIIGNAYFLHKFSERTLCTLKTLELSTDGQIQCVIVEISKTKELKRILRCICTEAVFEKHAMYLLKTGFEICGDLFNFPLYPAFSMSIYMSQGRTIPHRVSFIFTKSTYRDLYVAISRVTSSENINRVAIPQPIQYLVSTVLNFDVTDLKPLTLDKIKEKMINGNYTFYDVPPQTQDVLHTTIHSLTLDTVNERLAAREQLKHLVHTKKIPTTILKQKINKTDDSTLSFLLKIKNTVTSLATLSPLESCVWIHEFLREPNFPESMHSRENSIFSKHLTFLNTVCNLESVSNTFERDEDFESFMQKTSEKINPLHLKTEQGLQEEWVQLNKDFKNEYSVKCAQDVFIYQLARRDRNTKDIIYTLLKERLKTINDNMKKQKTETHIIEFTNLKRQNGTGEQEEETANSCGNDNNASACVKRSRVETALIESAAKQLDV